MASIEEILNDIKDNNKSKYGYQMRDLIYDGIKKCYEDGSKSGNANMEVSEARGKFDTLAKRLNNSDNVKADKTTINDLQSQINIEKARIDNITTLPERKYNRRCRTSRYKGSELMERHMIAQEMLLEHR